MIMKTKIDEHGHEYYDSLPRGWIPGQIGNFHVGGQKKLGMKYILEQSTGLRFELHTVTERTRAEDLVIYIKTGQLYVHK